MSGIRVITERGAVDVPVEIELQGGAVIDAYVEEHTPSPTPITPAASKPVDTEE